MDKTAKQPTDLAQEVMDNEQDLILEQIVEYEARQLADMKQAAEWERTQAAYAEIFDRQRKGGLR